VAAANMKQVKMKEAMVSGSFRPKRLKVRPNILTEP
jgi:hypothetical protein